MQLGRLTRRSLVAAGVTLGLAGGAIAIRTAADWTAAAATKVEPPPGMSQLQAHITVAQARSDALRAQIERLAGGSDRLADVVATANALAANDEAAASQLTSDIDQAKETLAALAAQPTPTPAPTPAPARRTTTTTAAGPAPTPTPAYRDDDDHHEGGGDD